MRRNDLVRDVKPETEPLAHALRRLGETAKRTDQSVDDSEGTTVLHGDHGVARLAVERLG